MKKRIKEIVFILIYYSVGKLKNLTRKRIQVSNPNKILVLSWHLIGDSFLALPAIVSLKRTYPESKIIVLCMPEVKELYEKIREIDKVKIASKGDLFKFGFVKEILFVKLDLLIDLTNNPYTVFISLLSRSKFKIGGSGINKMLHKIYYGFPLAYDRVCSPIRTCYAGDYMMKIISQLNIKINVASEWRFSGENVNDKREGSLDGISLGHLKIGFGIGASRCENLWLNERWKDLGLSLIAKFKAQIYLFGGQSDVANSEEITNLSEGKIQSYVGKFSLIDSIKKISELNYFITNDTGLMHVALHYRISTVILVGPSDYHNYIKIERNDGRIISKSIFCYPCYKFLNLAHSYTFEACKLGPSLCKTLIEVDEVVSVFEDLMEATRG